MDLSKIDRFMELQERANRQIETYGQAEDNTMMDLMELADSLTPDEVDEVTRRHWLEAR